MKFIVLNYGMDFGAWEEGQDIGKMVENYKEADLVRYNKVLKTSLNARWFDLYLKNDCDWPHPNRILMGLAKIAPYIHIDWMPEINYLGLYTDEDRVLDFLKTNFSYMLNTEASV